MKAKNFKEMTSEELNAKLKSLKQELFNLRFSNATGQLANPMQLKVVKKDIARVKTILTENEVEAFLLEANLIKTAMTKYNILLKDSKGYPYVKPTQEEYSAHA